MEINKAISNQNVIITLKGRLDTMTAPQLDDEVKGIDFDEVETVTLNLKDLEYISSSGLRVILALYKSLKGKGGNLKIVNVSNTIMELFSMTGMSDYLDIEQG
nr:STAS domain-containing protein [uncultured Ruminococcus sp.]